MNSVDPAHSPAVLRVPFQVPPDHPALAGHFPGHPMVPGVLLLDRVLDVVALQAIGAGADLRRLPQVKFSGPLQTGAPAEIILERTAGGLKFRIEQHGRLLAQGVFAPAD